MTDYDPDKWPDESNIPDGPGSAYPDENPVFTGPNSGRANYYYCKKRPWSRYCDRHFRPHCYSKLGWKPYPQWNGKCKKINQPDTIPAPKWPGYPKPDMPKRTRTKTRIRGRGRARKYRKKRRVARIARTQNLVPDYSEQAFNQFIVTSVGNEKQQIIGGGLNLWTPADIVARTSISPTVNTPQKVLLKRGKMVTTMTNLSPAPVYVTLWEFIPRNDYTGGKTPSEVYVQGIKDMDLGASNQNNPTATPYQSKMFAQQFIIKRKGFFRLENGEEKTVIFVHNPNKIFNTERLTSPGSTTLTSTVDVNWMKGITRYYGMSCLGGVHDVTTAGTSGVTGIGYAPVRVGVLCKRTYTSQAITGTVTADQVKYPSTSTLGFAGTGTGEAKISNEDTGTSITTWTSGALANQA